MYGFQYASNANGVRDLLAIGNLSQSGGPLGNKRWPYVYHTNVQIGTRAIAGKGKREVVDSAFAKEAIVLMTYSPQNHRLSFLDVPWLLDTRKEASNKTSPYIYLRAKVHRTMTSAFQGAPYFRRYGR